MLNYCLYKRRQFQPERIQGGEAWTEFAIHCPYNSEVCTDIACPTNTCPATSDDTDGHSNHCDTTNPFTVVLF